MAEHDKKHEKDGHGHSGGHKSHGGGHGGHGGGHDGEHEGAPEWLISFADNVVLMMGFFVILLAMNMGPKGSSPEAPPSEEETTAAAAPNQRMVDFVIALREGFNNPIDINSSNPTEQIFIQRIKERHGLENNPEAGPVGDAQDLQAIRPSDYHATAAQVSFELNSSRLSPAAVTAINDAAYYLKGLKVIVEVRGHASPAEGYDSPGKAWQLSFDRSLAVAQALNKAGVAWPQIRIVAAGDKERGGAPGHNDFGIRQNQRVEIVESTDLSLDTRLPPGTAPRPRLEEKPKTSTPGANPPAAKPSAPQAATEHH